MNNCWYLNLKVLNNICVNYSTQYCVGWNRSQPDHYVYFTIHSGVKYKTLYGDCSYLTKLSVCLNWINTGWCEAMQQRSWRSEQHWCRAIVHGRASHHTVHIYSRQNIDTIDHLQLMCCTKMKGFTNTVPDILSKSRIQVDWCLEVQLYCTNKPF